MQREFTSFWINLVRKEGWRSEKYENAAGQESKQVHFSAGVASEAKADGANKEEEFGGPGCSKQTHLLFNTKHMFEQSRKDPRQLQSEALDRDLDLYNKAGRKRDKPSKIK